MDIVRLNFSHGNYPEFISLIKNVRAAEKKTGKHLLIMQDLQGPKIRVGEMPAEGLNIKTNDQIILSTAHAKFVKGGMPIVPVQYKSLHRDLKAGDLVLIEDGLIELIVTKIVKNSIYCKAQNQGNIKSHKGINAPTASISAEPLTAKDLKDLKFGLKNNLDFVAISFVRKGADIVKLRNLIKKAGSKALICAKIERHEAIKNLDEIAKETDVLMVARGDLGVEIPAEEVPICQRKIESAAAKYKKPVIIATQMLQSMIDNPRPTRAEISDASNAMRECADCVMLSNETAAGKYPVEAVKVLSSVDRALEKYRDEMNKDYFEKRYNRETLVENICFSATDLARTFKAKIVVITTSGLTAKFLSERKLNEEIITIVPSTDIIPKLAFYWGLSQIYVKNFSNKNPLKEVKTFLKTKKICKTGETVVLIYNTKDSDKIIATIKI